MASTHPWLRPLGYWFLSLSLMPLLAGVFIVLFGRSMDDLNRQLWLFGTLGQALMDLTSLGLLSAWKQSALGVPLTTHLRSALFGMGLAALLAALRFGFLGHLMGGQFMGGVPAFTQALVLPSPGNWLAAPAALLAYGPGEALLVLTWIRAWDQVRPSVRPVLSPGVWIAAVLWAVPHLMNLPLQGLAAVTNTGVMVGVGLVFGILAKATRSPWGPLLFWTLANGTSL